MGYTSKFMQEMESQGLVSPSKSTQAVSKNAEKQWTSKFFQQGGHLGKKVDYAPIEMVRGVEKQQEQQLQQPQQKIYYGEDTISQWYDDSPNGALYSQMFEYPEEYRNKMADMQVQRLQQKMQAAEKEVASAEARADAMLKRSEELSVVAGNIERLKQEYEQTGDEVKLQAYLMASENYNQKVQAYNADLQKLQKDEKVYDTYNQAYANYERARLMQEQRMAAQAERDEQLRVAKLEQIRKLMDEDPAAGLVLAKADGRQISRTLEKLEDEKSALIRTGEAVDWDAVDAINEKIKGVEALREQLLRNEANSKWWNSSAVDFVDRTIFALGAGVHQGMAGVQAAIDMAMNPVEYLVGTTLGNVADMLGSEDLKKTAEAWTQASKEYSDNAKDLSGIAKDYADQATARAGKIDGWILNNLQSVGGMMFDAATMGMASAAGGAAGLTTGKIMAVRAAGNGMLDAANKGYSTTEQLLVGVANGALEYISEKMFGGNPIYDTEGGFVTDALAKVIKNPKILRLMYSKGFDIAAEGLEEVFVELLQPVAEGIITSSDIDWASPADLANAFAGGVFISLMGAGAQVMATEISGAGRAQRQAVRDAGAMIRNADAVQDLILEGIEAKKGTEAYELAVKMQNKLDSGETISTMEIGRLLMANQEAIEAGYLTEDTKVEPDAKAPKNALADPEQGFYAISIRKTEDGKNGYRLVHVKPDGSIAAFDKQTNDLFTAKTAAEVKGLNIRHIGTEQQLYEAAIEEEAEYVNNHTYEEMQVDAEERADTEIAAPGDDSGERIATEPAAPRNDIEFENTAETENTAQTGGIDWAGNNFQRGANNYDAGQNTAGASFNDNTKRGTDLGADQRTGEAELGTERGRNGTDRTVDYVENLRRSGSLKEIKAENLGFASVKSGETVHIIPKERYSEEMQILQDKAQALGIELEIVANPISVKQNGKTFEVAGIHKPGKIVIQANNDKMTMQQAFDHEVFHELSDNDPELVQTATQILRDEHGESELQDLWRRYAKTYGSVYNDSGTTIEKLAERIFEEMLADAYAGYNRYSEEKNPTKYKSTVKKAAEQSRKNVAEKNASGAGRMQTKANEAERDFEKTVENDPHIQRLIRMRNRGEISEEAYMERIDDYFENDAKMRAMTDELVRVGAESFSIEKNAFDAGYKEYDVTTAVYDIRNSPAERHKDLVKIGTMPELYRELFGINGNVYVSNEHLYQNIVSKETAINDGRLKKGDGADYHELGEDKVINAIMQSQNPVVLMESLKDYESPRLVSVVEETGHDGKNLIVVTELYADQMVFGEKQPRNHVLITVYEKRSLPDYVEKTLKKGRVLHIKKGLSPDTQASLQLAGGISEEVLKKNLAQFNKKVKAFKEEKKIDYSVVSEGEPGISWAGSEQTETYEDAMTEMEDKELVGDSLTEEIRHTAGGLESYLAAQPKRVQQRFTALKKESASKFATAIGLQTADGLTETIDELGNEYLENGRISNETRSRLFRNLPHANQKDAQSLEEHGDWAWADFNAAINAVCSNLAEVRRVMKQAAEHRKAYKETEGQEQTVAEFWVDAKVQRREMEKNKAKYLLTDSDKMIVGRLLRGEMQPEHINRNTNNYRGIMAVYEASQAYEDTMKKLRAYNLARREGLRQMALEIMKDLENWKDKKKGISYSTETMERNIRDIAPTPEIAEAFIEAYLTPVHRATAQENRLKNEMRERVEKIGLSRDVSKGNQISESSAVQLLGEARDNVAVLEHRPVGTLRDGKTLQEWKAEIDNLWQNNPKLDRAKIEAAIEEFRKIYDQLFKMMNETRIRNGYEPISYRKGYFPHFQSENPDTIMAKFGQAFGIQHDVKNLPASIVGLTENFLPGIPWFQNALERMAGDTTMDAVQGFDQYIEGAANVIYHTDNIQMLRALEQTLRYMASDEGLQKRVEKIRESTDKSDADKEFEIDRLYKEARYGMSNFIAELQEYTNNLAGKKSRYDRNMEIRLGRNMYNVVKSMEGRVAANMVAINLGSWLTNFAPLAQGTASVGSIAMIRGMASELANGGMASKWKLLRIGNGPDGFHEGSTFLTNRRGSERLVQTWSQKASGVLGSPMQWIDNYVSGSLVRAKYLQNLKEGMSAENAMEDADAWAASIMGDRSKGAMPTIFNEKNPVTKLFTMYQLEVKNNFSWLFKDLPREKRKKGIAAVALALLRYAIHAWLFNEIYEKIVGRRPAFDPIGMLNETAGDFFGYEVVNAVDFTVDLFNGGDLTLVQETQKQKPVKALGSLAENALEEMPFVGGLLGGGRIPVSSALPDWANLGTAVFNGEWESSRRIETIWQEISKPLFYLVPPFGGGQVKKAIEAGRAIVNRGSYNASGNLQYPVFADEAGDAIYSTLVGGIFGKTSLETGVDWVDSGFAGLNAKYTNMYQKLIEMDEGDRASWELLQDMRDAEVPEGEDIAAERRRILQESSVSGEAKYTVYYNLLASEKEREQMDALEGADPEDVFNLFTAMKEQDKAGDKQLILRSALTEQEKAILFDSTAEKENARLQAATKYVDSFLYADFLEAYAKKYTGETGKVQDYSGERVKEILQTMTGVSDKEKAAIWQITVNGKEGKSNPFSAEIGKEIWDNIQDLYEQIEQDGGIDWAGR